MTKIQLVFVAAAFTEAEVVYPSELKTFEANHPFLYYIKINNVIIFAGMTFTP